MFSPRPRRNGGKFLGALVFSIAVLLISFVGGELFTGNNMVMAFGAFDKQVSWKEAGKVWGVSYLGNFVGCFYYGSAFCMGRSIRNCRLFCGIYRKQAEYPAWTDVFQSSALQLLRLSWCTLWYETEK